MRSWTQRIIDLKSQVVDLPDRNVVASRLISSLSKTLVAYEADRIRAIQRTMARNMTGYLDEQSRLIRLQTG